MLSILDYVIFGATILLSSVIGLYLKFRGNEEATVQNFHMGNRQMSAIPVAISLVVSFMSSITFIGITAENYFHGTQFHMINLAYFFGVPFVTHAFLPVFYNLKITSANEYLAKRFGNGGKLVASAAFSIQMILYVGIVLYAPSLAISAVTGISEHLSILIIGFISAIYSGIGGLRAILIANMIQSILITVACYTVIFHGIVEIGFLEIFKLSYEGDRIEFFKMDLDPTVRHTVWTQIIGGMFIFLSVYAVNSAQVQRLCSVRSLKESQKSVWMSLPILIFLSFSISFAGLTLYAFYKGCDPLKEGKISRGDQLLPFYVVDNLSNIPGVVGLFIGCILSGSLTTASSAIIALAAVAWKDYLEPYFDKKSLTPGRITFINKLITIFYGFVAIGMAFIASHFSGVLQASLTIFGIVGGPLLGLFTLGMVFPFASEKPSITSFLIGLIVTFWIGFGTPRPPPSILPISIANCSSFDNSTFPSSYSSNGSLLIMEKEEDVNLEFEETHNNLNLIPPDTTDSIEKEYFYLYRLSYMWYTLIGFSITVILGAMLSLRYPQKGIVHPSLLSPIIYKIYNFSDQDQNEPAGLKRSESEEKLNQNPVIDIDDAVDAGKKLQNE